MNTVEVLKNVIHAALLQHLARMGLGEAVDPHTVHLIHLTLHETTAGLSDGHHVQQVGRRQQGLERMKRGFFFHWGRRAAAAAENGKGGS